MSCDGLVKNSRLSWALFFERLELTIFLWGSGEFQIHRDKCERSDPRSQWFHVFFLQSFQDDVLKPWNLMKEYDKNLGSLESSDSVSSRLSDFSGEDESPFWCFAHENELAALSTELARSIGAGANGLCIYMLGGCYPSLRTLGPRRSAKNRVRVSCQQLQVKQPLGPSSFWTPGILTQFFCPTVHSFTYCSREKPCHRLLKAKGAARSVWCQCPNFIIIWSKRFPRILERDDNGRTMSNMFFVCFLD